MQLEYHLIFGRNAGQVVESFGLVEQRITVIDDSLPVSLDPFSRLTVRNPPRMSFGFNRITSVTLRRIKCHNCQELIFLARPLGFRREFSLALAG